MTDLNTLDELIDICKTNNIPYIGTKKKPYSVTTLIKIIKAYKLKDNSIKEENIDSSIDSISNKLNMIDLFAGTGAFSLAFNSTNSVNIVFSNDMCTSSKKIYDENFEHKLTLKNLNDINVEDIPPHDILTGGFPCQPFSIAGLQEGFKDERSNVFWKILSIIDLPKLFFLKAVG
jgi:adenine-specific DNA methylase